MGGDGGVTVTLPAAAQVLQEIPELTLFLVGDNDRMGAILSSFPVSVRNRIEVVHTGDCIGDDAKPANVLRTGKQTSMYQAVELVKSGTAQATVSAGNTGALLMIGRHLLKTLPGIQKPALVATIPVATRRAYLLDVGANPECDGQQLFEFAVMGSVLAESLSGEPARVGLLNIGSEQHKGTDEVQQAAALLEACAAINYVGFIEANALLAGKADVIVCDGFVGNVTIKSSAGVANVVRNIVQAQIRKHWLNRLSAMLSASLLRQINAQIDPHRFNGASLLGLQGSVVKSHGNASQDGFAHAIRQAVKEVENGVPQLIAKKVAAIMAAH
jgi:glycerol-3-phosphate acyltransferase PlsX